MANTGMAAKGTPTEEARRNTNASENRATMSTVNTASERQNCTGSSATCTRAVGESE